MHVLTVTSVHVLTDTSVHPLCWPSAIVHCHNTLLKSPCWDIRLLFNTSRAVESHGLIIYLWVTGYGPFGGVTTVLEFCWDNL